jgi:hypothetical protein
MSGFFSGSFDASWPHIVLLSVAIIASIAVAIGIVMESPHWSIANVLVVGGVAIEAICTILLFGFDEGISQSQQAKIIAMQARPWTKSQFDALQAVKGKVSRVGIFPEKGCLECGLFAGDIELALHSAGVEIYRDDNLDWMSGTGIHVWLPRDSSPPSDKSSDPLIAAMSEAGLYPGFGFHNPPELSPVRTDIPVIFVGEKPPSFSGFPYSPIGSSQWTMGPLRNPAFAPPDPATNRPTTSMHFRTDPKQ